MNTPSVNGMESVAVDDRIGDEFYGFNAYSNANKAGSDCSEFQKSSVEFLTG